MSKKQQSQGTLNENEIVVLTPAEQKVAELKAKAAELAAELKAAKAEAKGVKPKKELKGQMVTFTNKAGETITGLGNLYYVVRQGGKLHYKEQNSVTVMTAEEITAWEEANKA